MKLDSLCRKTSLWSLAVGLTVVATSANAALFISDAIEGKALNAVPNNVGVQVGLPATSAAWTVTETAPGPASGVMFVQSGSELGGQGANLQTLHFLQTDAVTPPGNVRSFLTADTALKSTDVAAGNSVTFSFSVKWNSIPDAATQGFNALLFGGGKLATVVSFKPGTFYLTSGSQSLFVAADPASTLQVGKWYQFVQTIDLALNKYTTDVTVLNGDGSVFDTASNTVVQNFTQATTELNQLRLTIDGRTADLEVNDISITYNAVPEPTSLGLMGLGTLLMVARKRHM